MATIPSDSANRSGPYGCNGSRTTFTFSFGLDDDDDLTVIKVTAATGVQETLTKTTHYTITGANTNDPLDLTQGGTVTTVTAYSSSYEILLIRDAAKTQTTNLDDEDVEGALDKLTRLLQDLAEKVSRCIQVQEYDSNDTVILSPAGTAGYLYRQADGDVTSVAQVDDTDLTVTNYWQTRIETDVNNAEVRDAISIQKEAFIDISEAPYNVLPDDAAADQSTGFQAALTAAAAGNKYVLIPGGHYRIDTGLTLGPGNSVKYGIDIVGLGHPRITWGGATGATMLTVTSVGESRLHNIWIDGNDIADVNGIKWTTLGASKSSQRNSLFHVTIADCNGTGIWFEQEADATCDYFSLYECSISSGGRGMYVTGGVRQVFMMGCSILDNSTYGTEINAGQIYGYGTFWAGSGISDLYVSGPIAGFKIFGGGSESDVILTGSVNAQVHEESLGPNILNGFHQDQGVAAGGDAIVYDVNQAIRIENCKFQGNVNIGSTVPDVFESGNEFESTYAFTGTTSAIRHTTHGPFWSKDTDSEEKAGLFMHGNHYLVLRSYTDQAAKLPLYLQQQDSTGTTTPFGIDASGDTTLTGTLTLGANSTTQGKLIIWDGGGGNTPGYIKIHSPNGTAWYLFVEDDGSVKVHNAAPTQNSDGTVIGTQS